MGVLGFLAKEGEGEVMGAAGIVYGVVIVIIAILIYSLSSGGFLWNSIATAVLFYGLYQLALGGLHLNPVTNTALNVASTAHDVYTAAKS